MFRGLLVDNRETKVRILLSAALFGCIVWLALTFFRRSAPVVGHPTRQTDAAQVATPQNGPAARKLEGDGARAYLEQTNDGQSIMKALEVERFGLKWQDHSPFDSTTNLSLSNSGAGYLAMSHDENLNVWFDDEGAMIRPTVSQKDQDKSWRLEMKLKAYGYGDQLQTVLPAVGHKVKENRIEYVRTTDKPVGAGLVPARSDSTESGQGQALPLQNPPSPIVEWYENRAEGIEQGFTFNERPVRARDVASNEPLRLIVAVNGDLRARASEDGQSVELSKNGNGLLTYSHLVATDAAGKKLTARMETTSTGDDISLIVDDANAQYPIVIDPITATLTQKLDASILRQQDARFGFAVAIDVNTAVVGAWREDNDPTQPDAGAVYVFTRNSGSAWSAPSRFTSKVINANNSCGWSVAVRDLWIAFGCPGADNSTGKAVFRNSGTQFSWEIDGTDPTVGVSVGVGARLGHSIAIGSSDGTFYHGAIGAPLTDKNSARDSGSFVPFGLGQSGMAVNWQGYPEYAPLPAPGGQFGTSLATDGNTMIVGEPGRFDAATYSRGPGNNNWTFGDFLYTGAIGDDFGNSVALSGNIAVIGAPLDDTRGVDAGAAYVYTRGGNGTWSSPERLTANDARAGDHFSENAVAIRDNTIVVGAYAHDYDTQELPFNFNEDRGAAYVFTRNYDSANGTSTWIQQTEIQLSNLSGGEAGAHFGIAVAIDYRFGPPTVLIGARAATAGSTTRAGAAYSFLLDCAPPWDLQVFDGRIGAAYCPGESVTLTANYGYVSGSKPTFQWIKNGAIIQGATESSYTIPSASTSDAASYQFVASNACSSIISPAHGITIYSFSLTRTAQTFSVAGSNGIVNVKATGSSCGWTAVRNVSWITITSGSSGTGDGTVSFTVAANSGPARTGTMTIAGQTFTVSQDGAGSPGPTIFIADGTVNEAAAIDSVTFVRGPFRVLTNFNFSTDRHTRVMIFTSSLGLTQPESSILSVQAAGFPLTVENVGPVTGVTGLNGSYIVVRLPDGLPTGDLPVTVTLRGVQSGNAPTIRISP